MNGKKLKELISEIDDEKEVVFCITLEHGRSFTRGLSVDLPIVEPLSDFGFYNDEKEEEVEFKDVVVLNVDTNICHWE